MIAAAASSILFVRVNDDRADPADDTLEGDGVNQPRSPSGVHCDTEPMLSAFLIGLA